MNVNDIIAEVDTPHVVITGGEPTLYDLDSLIMGLQMNNIYVQLETSGQQGLKGEWVPDWITISPKRNLGFEIPGSLMFLAREIKWVVDDDLTLDPVIGLWNLYKSTFPEHSMPWFYFMPEGVPSRKEMMDKTLQWLYFVPTEMQERWRICDRLQYRLEVR